MLISDPGATLSRQIVSINFSSRMTHTENLEPSSRKIFVISNLNLNKKKENLYGFSEIPMATKKDHRSQLFHGKPLIVIPIKWKKKYAKILDKESVDFD